MGGLAAVSGLALLAVALAGAANRPASAPPGLAVSTGAAAGYVEDRVCANCHSGIAESYRGLGMARSFYKPGAGPVIEDFGAADFDHPVSRQHFAMERRGAQLIFKRWQVAADGRPIHLFEQPVDWVLGSGNHARVYLYKTGDGELYQLPLAWYSQEKRWGMAPGYDRPDHEGVLRRVRRECLFCHNAFPEAPVGSDAYGAPQVFPERLPEGIGCQRCHGPGGEHVRRAAGALEEKASVRAAIVNPAHLPGTLGDDVCYQCHLQPEVALPMVRRFGRGDDSFRPGEPLADAIVHTDLTDEGGTAPEERFEINHHAYRLRQSRCFTAAVANSGRLHCWTCHDPHRRLPTAELAARVRATCLTCHLTGSPTACKRPVDAAGPAHPDALVDCASCHMPKRRPRDVVHVVMTDHKIQRRPSPPRLAELTAPRAEADPEISGVRLYDPGRAPAGELGQLYLTLSVVRAGAFPSAVERLEKWLEHSPMAPITEPEPYLELAAAQMKARRFPAAEQTLGGVLARFPDHPLALAWLGVSRAALGRPAEAEDLLRRALARPGSDLVETRFNLGLVLAGTGAGRAAEAVPLFEQALAGRFNLVSGWVHLGAAEVQRSGPGDLARAADSYRRALELDPAQTDAYLGLGRVLLRQGKREEALRVLKHGATAARRPPAVAAALRETMGE